MMIRKLNLLFLFIFLTTFSFAQKFGGMWIPTELNEKEMKDMGMKISAKEIFNTEVPSIKDAIVHFGGGCTGELISENGLLLTNHHCGYGNIQRLSTVENDLLKNGFWAKNNKEELPNPGLTATIIIDIREVTDSVLQNTETLTGTALDAAIRANASNILKNFSNKNGQSTYIKPFYNGNKFYLFVDQTFRDVRLVGAPPESIGKFGADTDNWVWPRHTGDFSLFRIYADKNNQPAEYSDENIPYKPKYFLPISAKGIKEDDFVFVFGFPGITDEYLPSAALQQVKETVNPARIEVRDAALKIMGEEMRKDDVTRIKYASKFASIANYWKKWIGENQGLEKSNAVEKRKEYEEKLATKNPEIKSILKSFSELYAEQNEYAKTKAYYDELIRNSEGLKLAMNYNNFLELHQAGKWNENTNTKMLAILNGIYSNYDPNLDAAMTAKLLSIAATKIPARFLPSNSAQFQSTENNLSTLKRWYNQSFTSGLRRINGETVNSNLEKVFSEKDVLINNLKNDSLILFAKYIRDFYNKNVAERYIVLQNELDNLQKTYMALQMKTDKLKVFFPDANSTLRVTYGKVKGSQPSDAKEYLPQTYLKGVMEKYVPGDYEFDVPQKLIDLYNKKDFGTYKDYTGDMPIAFTSTSHTTGGNSGSPALDARGNLVGLNFDRQWEGTMSDLHYDPEICRNIMVDVRYILFIIDKYADAKWLIKEMKIIN